MISALGAIVPAPPVPDYATWDSGGPITHGGKGTAQVDIERHFVMPGGGQANDIEGDPDSPWVGRPYGFNVNGEFTLGDAAVGGNALPPMHMTANVVSSIGPTITAAIGAGFGAYLAPQHRATGTIVGALVGGVLGLIFSPG